MAREISEFERNLNTIIRPLRAVRWAADFRWDSLERALTDLGEEYGGLELNPDFQRGHVWTPEQQTHFIENCLRGVVPDSGKFVQFNSPEFGDEDDPEADLPRSLQCVDGLQRLTAIMEYVKGNIKPFGFTAEQLLPTAYSPRRMFLKIGIHAFTRRAQLLTHYLDINAGGTPHSAEEIERVRGLLAALKPDL